MNYQIQQHCVWYKGNPKKLSCLSSVWGELEILVKLPYIQPCIFPSEISCHRMKENHWNRCAVTQWDVEVWWIQDCFLETDNRGGKEFHSCRKFREFDRAGRYKGEKKKRNIKIYGSNSDGKVLQYLCEHFELCKSLLFRMIHCQLQVAAVTDILSFIITVLS